MSVIHHRTRPVPNLWWYAVAAAVLVGILMTVAIAQAHTGTSVRADTNAVTTETSSSRAFNSPCGIARQDALSAELAHSRCSALGGSGTTVTRRCFAVRQDALSVELAHSLCHARRP